MLLPGIGSKSRQLITQNPLKSLFLSTNSIIKLEFVLNFIRLCLNTLMLSNSINSMFVSLANRDKNLFVQSIQDEQQLLSLNNNCIFKYPINLDFSIAFFAFYDAESSPSVVQIEVIKLKQNLKQFYKVSICFNTYLVPRVSRNYSLWLLGKNMICFFVFRILVIYLISFQQFLNIKSIFKLAY